MSVYSSFELRAFFYIYFSSSSVLLRPVCFALQCMSVILDNSVSHPLMEKLLPALKSSLHDSSEKVRVAFVGMLLKIKAVRAAKVRNIYDYEEKLMFKSHSEPFKAITVSFHSTCISCIYALLLIFIASIVLICKSLWIKASAKLLNVK